MCIPRLSLMLFKNYWEYIEADNLRKNEVAAEFFNLSP